MIVITTLLFLFHITSAQNPNPYFNPQPPFMPHPQLPDLYLDRLPPHLIDSSHGIIRKGYGMPSIHRDQLTGQRIPQPQTEVVRYSQRDDTEVKDHKSNHEVYVGAIIPETDFRPNLIHKAYKNIRLSEPHVTRSQDLMERKQEFSPYDDEAPVTRLQELQTTSSSSTRVPLDTTPPIILSQRNVTATHQEKEPCGHRHNNHNSNHSSDQCYHRNNSSCGIRVVILAVCLSSIMIIVIVMMSMTIIRRYKLRTDNTMNWRKRVEESEMESGIRIGGVEDAWSLRKKSTSSSLFPYRF